MSVSRSAGLIAGDACGKDLGFEERGGQRRALQIFDDVEQSVEAAARLHDALPAGEQASERMLLDGLDFFAQAGERSCGG